MAPVTAAEDEVVSHSDEIGPIFVCCACDCVQSRRIGNGSGKWLWQPRTWLKFLPLAYKARLVGFLHPRLPLWLLGSVTVIPFNLA